MLATDDDDDDDEIGMRPMLREHQFYTCHLITAFIARITKLTMTGFFINMKPTSCT
jgi:hypothetical protein